MTWRDVDNVLLGGAVQGISGVAGGLAKAGGERAKALAMNHATGALVGYGTEWQRALLLTTNKRPNRQGHVVATTDHPANVIDYGDAVTVELRGYEPFEGVVFGWDDECLELEEHMSTYPWEEIESIDVEGVTVWSCYSGDERRDYSVGPR